MKYFTLQILLCFSLSWYHHAYGQIADRDQSITQSNQILTFPISPHCGIEANLLVRELELEVSQALLREKYQMREQEGQFYIPVIISVREGFDKSLLHDLGIGINSDLGTILTAHIPTEHYTAFIELPGIEYVEIARPVFARLDKALEACNIPQVHVGENLSQSYQGKDVVVGVLDVGFDYTHPTFYDPESGKLRIKKVWEQNFSFRSSPVGYNYGQELDTEAVIIAEKTDLVDNGHGTHVAGVVAGNGGTLSSKYRGVASASDIVLISLNMQEGFEELNTGVIDGINYVFEYAESVGKPAVVNLSQGHHSGPHDGTSLTDQAIDALSGPGRIIVGAVGNEGDARGFLLHFDHDFAREKEILNYLVWPDSLSAGKTTVEIWGEESMEFSVGVEVYNPHTKTREAVGEMLSTTEPKLLLGASIVDLEGDTIYFDAGVQISPLNNRPHIQLRINSTSQSRNNDVNLIDLIDNDFIQLRFKSDGGVLHAYAANNFGEAFFGDLSGIGSDKLIEGLLVVGGTAGSTMGELGGTARRIISVGGYNTASSFVNILGEKISTDNHIGAQYISSSMGPTLDGRLKPDISAPAGLISSAENSFQINTDAQSDVDQIMKEDGSSWTYGVRQGTSSSAPIVAGIIAFMLEVDPNLTPEDAKVILSENAMQDEFTGDLPNQIWGFGKVDAAAVMSSLDQPTSSLTLEPKPFKVYPNPTSGEFRVESEFTGDMQIRILTTTGSTIYEATKKRGSQWVFNLPDLTMGLYVLHVKQDNRMMQQKMIFLK